jgi:hypothetical protein
MRTISPSRAAEKQSRRAAAPFPAPTPALFRLLGLLRRPIPAGELRSAAAAAGLTTDETEAAIRTATRRQVIGLALVGSTACYVWGRP